MHPAGKRKRVPRNSAGVLMKPFDLDLYTQDDKAKLIIIDWLKTFNIEATVNPDQYGIGLLASGPKGYYEIEVEVKHNWTGPQFPFGTVHFAGRKEKFIKDSERNLFIMLNDGLTHCLVVNGKELSKGTKVHKRTVYTEGEDFIEVPLDQCKVLRIL